MRARQFALVLLCATVTLAGWCAARLGGLSWSDIEPEQGKLNWEIVDVAGPTFPMRIREAAGCDTRGLVTAFEANFHSALPTYWTILAGYLALEQPFRTDLDYYEGRADGIASVRGVSGAEARRDLAKRHELARAAPPCRGDARWPGAADAVRARLSSGRGERS